MRRQSFELTESLLPENPLEGLEPEPDVLANITARARARRRGEIEETPVTQITQITQNPAASPTRPEPAPAATESEPAAQLPPEPHIVYFSATLDDGPLTLVSPDGRRETLASAEELERHLKRLDELEVGPTAANPQAESPAATKPAESLPDAVARRTRRQPISPPHDAVPLAGGEAHRTQTDAINRESIRVDTGNNEPAIDLDDPDLMSGTHATTLRIDWEVIQGLKRIARDLSRPRKECTMGMLILHALKQTYPDLFEKP